MSRRSPLMSYLFGDFGEYCTTYFWDVESPLRLGLKELLDKGLDVDAARREFEGLVADESLTDAQLREQTTVMDLPHPASTRDVLRYLVTRWDPMLSELRDGSPASRDSRMRGSDMAIDRRSRFPDVETANRATTLVLRAHEARLRAWAAGEGTPSVLFLSADVPQAGDPVGWVRRLNGNGTPVGESIPTHRVVVLMAWLMIEQKPLVSASYPELPYDTVWAERFPELTQLFGGLFGQDVYPCQLGPWYSEGQLYTSWPRDVVDTMARQLGELLAEVPDDAALVEAVHSLGCCLEAHLLPEWVAGLHRRMTQIPW